MPIGTPYQGGFFGGQISTSGTGIPDFNLVVGPAAAATTLARFKNGRTLLLGAQSFIDGPGNTLAMVLDGDATVYPAAHFCYNLTVGGYDDWYMPAPFEFSVLTYYLKLDDRLNTTSVQLSPGNPYSVPPRAPNTPTVPTVTLAPAYRTGGPQAYTGFQTWTSRQANASQANAGFFNTLLFLSVRLVDDSAAIRAIRRVPV
jgi:hypothetical protein